MIDRPTTDDVGARCCCRFSATPCAAGGVRIARARCFASVCHHRATLLCRSVCLHQKEKCSATKFGLNSKMNEKLIPGH